MGEHSSLTLLHKLVRIISFLLLWQFGCGSGIPVAVVGGTIVVPCGPGTPYGPCTYECRSKGNGTSCPPNQGLPCEEAEALQSFLEALGVPVEPSIPRSYCSDTKPNASIVNITCNCFETVNLCHITGIVSYASLSGHITGGVSCLGSLEELDLSYNQLDGIIPYSLGTLSNLTVLNLGGNQLTGSIPETLGNLTKLTSFDLSNNQLSGSIPDCLGNLSKLTYFDLSYNQLSGSIPDCLGNLSKLTDFNLSNNQLSGSIPDCLENLSNLTYFYLNRNFLTGKIPTSLGEVSSLQYMDLSSNKLDGKIPDELGKLTKLQKLSLVENNLTGPLPESLGELSNLQNFWLNSNNFTGNLPQNYSQLTSLVEFGVAGNSLSGSIPSYIEKWVNLTELNLLGNNFEGQIPSEIFNMTNLESLWVSDLNNSGFSLPKNATLSNITSLVLRNCSINGTIPSNIWDWTGLSYLDLSFNQLTGEIPSLKNYAYFPIREMYLTGNMLSGVVPAWINDTILDKADLSYNNFTNVTFPDNQTNLALSSTDVINIEPDRDSIWNMSKDHCPDGKSKYQSLFINSGGEEANINGTQYEADDNLSNFCNKTNWAYTCSGDFLASSYSSSDYIQNLTCGVSVPDEALYKNARLCPVSLKYYGFCLHEGSYRVKLHFAEILFTENADYSSLGKRIFDVYVQGERVLKDFNIKEKAGGPNKVWVENFTTHVNDDNLLTIHFFWAGKGSVNFYQQWTSQLNGPLISAISVTPNFKVGGGGLSTWKIAVITTASILAPLLLLALLWRMGLIGDRELRESKVQLRGKPYSVKQIIDATRKFSPEMEIGRERFGIVYKAELPDKVVVAVKNLSPQSKQVIDQIRSEVDAEKEKLSPQSKQVIDQTRSEVDAQKEKLSPQSKEIIDQIRSEVDAQKEKLSPQSKQVIDQIIDQSEVNAQKEKPCPQSKQVVDQIRSEVDVQKEYKHENLVELLDGYSKKDLRLMIYEYMEHRLDPKTVELSWENRCDICLGMAEGLKYLHERMVIHGSIKPSNILLDRDLKAKISDIPYTFIGKEGPNVYTAPEHATRADHTTDKVDVYSFGLVLLELISGKKSEAENLADWACSNLQEFVIDNNLDFVDNKLPRTFNPEQAKNILKLAVKCVNISPALRPTMSEVVNQLRCNASILHNLRIGE